MRMVLQRVKHVELVADGKPFDEMGQGILAMVGIEPGDDSPSVMKYMLDKLIHLRIFEDEQGKLNLSVTDKGFSLFLVSNFTLYGDCNKGNRPSFVNSMFPEPAIKLYKQFNEILRNEYNMVVEEGIFGAHMILDPICDGPVTIELEF